MYFPYWLLLVVFSLWASIIAFIWAIRSGQFADQGRARYLALSDGLPPLPAGKPSKLTLEVYVLLFVLAAGLAALVAASILSFFRVNG
jgi:cbb3-type cytochrome oxidase maturation protein